jgi:hypothetical protein
VVAKLLLLLVVVVLLLLLMLKVCGTEFLLYPGTKHGLVLLRTSHSIMLCPNTAAAAAGLGKFILYPGTQHGFVLLRLCHSSVLCATTAAAAIGLGKFILYPGTQRGFAVRGSRADPAVNAAREYALRQGLGFFKQHLAGEQPKTQDAAAAVKPVGVVLTP